MTDDMQGHYDSADQAVVDNAGKDAARREADDRETIRIWMSHEKGRDLLFRIVFEVCHLGDLFTAVDNDGRSDPLRTYLHLGERNIGAWFDNALREHPALYTKMLTEQKIDAEARNERLRRQNKRDETEATDERQD